MAVARERATTVLTIGDAPGHWQPRVRRAVVARDAAVHRHRGREAPLCGMEVVEVSPPYDSGDITSLLACRSIPDVLAVLVAEGKLGRRAR